MNTTEEQLSLRFRLDLPSGRPGGNGSIFATTGSGRNQGSMAKSSGPASPPSLMPPKACEPLAAGTKLEGTGQAVPPVIEIQDRHRAGDGGAGEADSNQVASFL